MAGVYAWINLAEAALWIAMGTGVFAWTFCRRRGAKRSAIPAVVLAAGLIAFGASDIVETQTGAWWRPWWLLVWKAACVAVIAGVAGPMLLRR